MNSPKENWYELREEIQEFFLEKFGYNLKNPTLPTCIYHVKKDISEEIDIPIKFEHEREFRYRCIDLLDDRETIKVTDILSDDDEQVEFIEDKQKWKRYEFLLLNRWNMLDLF